MKGLEDDRGKLFLDYIRIIKLKRPKFFVIENVAGIISDKHFKTFREFLRLLGDAGYWVKYSVLNASDYGVPQDRIRVFIVGTKKEYGIDFSFPEKTTPFDKHITLRKAIGDINEAPRFYNSEVVLQNNVKRFWNHDCYTGPYDKKFMARNRVRTWDEVSFTIQAQARNTPLHPQAPPMIYISPNERRFDPNHLDLYRRLSVRECARIQTFPDSFHFIYNNILDGYKMVGNAVPPRLAKHLAFALKAQLANLNIVDNHSTRSILVGYYRDEEQLRLTKENKLYYVRTGFRPGAMQMPPEKESPDYLLLHKGSNYEIFRLQNPPIIKYREELEMLGFKPHGDVYLCFSIKDFVDKFDISLDSNTITEIKNSTKPFIIER